MAANNGIRGGIEWFKWNGKTYDVAEDITYILGEPMRDADIGATGFLGVTETAQAGSVDVTLVDRGDLDLSGLIKGSAGTVSFGLRNGKALTGANFYPVGDFSVSGKDGRISAKFAGPRLTEL
jgi:hypothetical protein